MELWDHHKYSDERQGIVYRAVGQAMTALGNGRSNDDGRFSSALWRVVDGAEKIPIRSTLNNITLPFFVIDSFEWVVDPNGSIDSDSLKSVDIGSSRLNYTSPSNPMQQGAPGILALLPNTSWTTTFDPNTPPQEPTVATGDYYVAIKIGWVDPAVSCDDGPREMGASAPWTRYVPHGVHSTTAVPRFGVLTV